MSENENRSTFEKQPNNFLKKVKSTFSKAKMSRYIGLLAVIVATVVLSLWQVGWNPEKIGWETFFANTSLLLFLGIYGIFFGENEGHNLFKNMITGVYQTTRDAFLNVVDKITEKSYTDALPDYITWRYQKDYENECEMKLLAVRLFDKTILDLSDEQIEELRRHPIEVGTDKHYSRISEEQYKVISDIRSGRVFVDYIEDYNFYLVEENSSSEQMVTRVKRTNKRKEKISWQQRLTRVLMIGIVAFILAGFFRKVAENGGDPNVEAEAQFQAIRDLVSRISCLVVSIASGFNTARLLNMEDVFVLKYKTSYDEVFYCCMENKTFIPINYQEKAKAEFEKFKKEEEEAKNNVITPEIANSVTSVTMIEDKTIY